MSEPLVLIAHGSRDPRSGAAIERLVCRVAARRPGLPVAAAYLEHLGPRPLDVLGTLGAPAVRVVPLLLTAAYHGSVDVPAVLDAARDALPGTRIAAGTVLGPGPELLDALDERLPAHPRGRLRDRSAAMLTAPSPAIGFDGIVLGAAGTRDAAARAAIGRLAADYGARHGVPCVPAFASASGPTVPEAAAALRAAGSRTPVLASYFLAPGRLHDRIVAGARAERMPVGAPFAGTAAVADLVLARHDAIAVPEPVLV